MTNYTAYALGFFDGTHRLAWFVHRESSLGNMMRTDKPYHARLWASAAEVELWIDNLPGHARAQLAGKPLIVFGLSVAVDGPVATIAVEEVVPDAPPAPKPTVPARKAPRPPAPGPAESSPLFV